MIACRVCKGLGRWQETEEYAGLQVLVWHECGTCHGTGAVPDLDDDQAPENTFDIGGSSFMEDYDE